MKRKQQPNILLIYTDQQRYDTIGALGNRIIKTPNLDRLVDDGVAFTHATTSSPVCVPARWSLHTGMWPTTHGTCSNHHWAERPPFDLPNLLRQTGYRTGLIGKNHSFLTRDDFDYFAPNPTSLNTKARETLQRWEKEQAEDLWPRLAEEPAPGGIEGTHEHAQTDDAMRFIESSGDQPFFLWLSYLFPHSPYWVPEPFFSMYATAPIPAPAVEPEGLAAAGKPFRQQFHQLNNDGILPFTPEQVMCMQRVYYGMVSCIDNETGRLLEFLATKNILENTLVVFTSDHGDYMGDHGLITKSPSLYDCLVRVPLIFRWPESIDRSRQDARFASAVDLLPTFIDVAGGHCPHEVQGKSILPFLRDNGNDDTIRPAAFCEYGVPGIPYNKEKLVSEGISPGDYRNPYDARLPWEGNPVALAGRIRMIRTHEWKYIDEENGIGELYDLINDPHELTNLYGKPDFSKIQTELHNKLHDWIQTLRTERKTNETL